MSFMKPEVFFGTYFAVETTQGTEIVPGFVFTRTCATAAEAFAEYVEGKIYDDEELIEVQEGWLARMSAPGYLDCTDWTVHKTSAAAHAYLIDMYDAEDTEE